MTRKFKATDNRASNKEKAAQKRRTARAARWANRNIARAAERGDYEAIYEAKPAGYAS